MTKKKVLIFNPKFTAGGISKIISDYIKNFSDNVNVEIMTLKIENDIYTNDLKNKIYEIGDNKKFFSRLRKEYEIIKKQKYDVVHVNGDFVSRILECFIAKIVGVKKIIIHSHNNGVSDNPKSKIFFQKYIKKLFDYLATDYFACSVNAAEWMFSKSVIKGKKYKIINNGIDTEKFKFDNVIREELRKKYDLNNKFVIGNVGRFTYQKNHDFLINIFKECKKSNDNAILILIGNGELKESIKEKIKEENLEDSVLFFYNRNDVYKFYNAMDAFVLPSRYEGLGIVNIEAQTSGLPTIVSNNVPIEAKVTNLIKFLPLDEKLQKWSEEILEHKDVEERLNAYKKVKNAGFDIKDVVKKLEKIYM